MRQLSAARLLLSAFIAAGLAQGCAGGGGGGGGGMSPSFFPPPTPPVPPPPPPPPPPPLGYPDPNSSEYRANWGVDSTNAVAAWQRGFTGEGVTVGVIDDGIDLTHPELQGRISPDSMDINSSRDKLGTAESGLSHGAELSSLIVGNFNNSQTVGVAYGATVLAVRADNGSGSFNESDLANALNYAVSKGVDIVNFSLGSTAPSTTAFTTAIRAATAAGVIVVVSAGNDGASAPNVNYPGYFATDPSVSHGLILVAGGLNSNGTINTQSNPPGAAASWYLTAPGWEIIVPDYGPPGPVPNFQQCGMLAGLAPDLCRIQGTSYASPHVAGALALLMDASPGMTPAQLVDLLLNSARDAGAVGTDNLYGRGILDIARAFQPVGPLMVATPQGVDTFVVDTIGVTGGAFGDAFADRHAWAATAFDHYGRSFEVSLARGWLQAAPRNIAVEQAPALWRQSDPRSGIVARFAEADPLPPQALSRRLHEEPDTPFHAETQLADGMRIAMGAHTPAYDESKQSADANAHLAFAGSDLAVAVTRPIGQGALSFMSQSSQADLGPSFGESARIASAVRFEEELGQARVALTAGGLREHGAILGSTWTSPWGEAPESATTFAGMSVSWSPLAHVEAAASGEYGRTTLSDGEWLKLSAPLVTTAFSAALRFSGVPVLLAERGASGALTLSVSQPLRVEDGAFSAMLPQSDAWGRAHLAFAPRTISASPTGREIETRLGYWLWRSDEIIARAEVAHRSEPGHRADAEDATEVLLGVRLRK